MPIITSLFVSLRRSTKADELTVNTD